MFDNFESSDLLLNTYILSREAHFQSYRRYRSYFHNVSDLSIGNLLPILISSSGRWQIKMKGREPPLKELIGKLYH
ncbi:hypothetical protein L2E82_45871 [Cichorium intybus]|uniref:Uncharacterized protein n=1 Tax=Cichorium intybus TaxID=13427 RepID=A0ACB8ZTR1_CICIN|nr:hypothetical protein L2E82_45871 [Cichorium intybus]